MRIRSIGAALIVAIFVSGCNVRPFAEKYEVIYSMETSGAAEATQNGRKYTIALVPKVAGIPYFDVAADGAKEAALDLGVEVVYRGPEVADSDEQIEVIRELIEEPVDLLAVSANDPEKLLPVLAEARREGIEVITWDADTQPAGREFFVNMVDPETLGRHLMDTLAWSTREEGEFAIMTGALSASNLNEWIGWIEAQRRQYYPNMKLLAIEATDDDTEKAYEVAKRLLRDYPELDGIIGNSSVGPPAAAQAVKEAGKAGDVRVVGLSTPNVMREHLKEGSAQVATLWSPKKLGYLTVVLAKDYLDGKLPYDGQEVYKVGNIRVNGDMVIMGEPLDFTKENVDQYDF